LQEKSEEREEKGPEVSGSNSRKLICFGCANLFSTLESEMCYNCNKILKAVREFTSQRGGRLEVVKTNENAVFFTIYCQHGHSWLAPFKSKQAKKWCLECKLTEKEMLRRYFQELDEKQIQELSMEQDKLLNQARINMFQSPTMQDSEDVEEETTLDYKVYTNPQTSAESEDDLRVFSDALCTDQQLLTERLLSVPQSERVFRFL